MSQADLRSKIGFVPQKAILFSGTIKDNLRYGKEDATDKEIKHARKSLKPVSLFLKCRMALIQ